MNMTLPSNAEVAAVLREVFGEDVTFQGPPESVAMVILHTIREALAATQEPARFDGEKALAEFEAKPNWLQADNETVREWRDGDPMPAGAPTENEGGK